MRLAVLEVSAEWPQRGEGVLVVPLAEVMELCNAADILGPSHASELQPLLERTAQLETALRIQQELATAIAENPSSFWSETTPEDSVNTREDFSEATKRYEEAIERERATRYAVELLLRFEPDEQFAHNLWRATAYADWREKNSTAAWNDPILDQLLRAGEQLPSGSDEYLEVQFLRGRYLHRRGHYEQELALFNRLEQAEIEDSWKRSLYTRMGQAQEALLQYEAAADSYTKLLPKLLDEEDADLLEVQLRAVYIYLELGEIAQARRLLDTFGLLDEAVIARSPYSAQINELVALNRQGNQLEDYCSQWKNWWPHWQAFLRCAGGGLTAPGTLAIPDFQDPMAVYREMGQALQSGDTAAYLTCLRRLVSAARWHPARAAELITVSQQVMQCFPECLRQWRELTAEMGPALRGVPAGKWTRNAQVWYVVNLFDLGRLDEARAVAEHFYDTDNEHDEIRGTMNRLSALIAVRQSEALDEAAARLQEDLEKPDLLERGYTVVSLMQVYQATGDVEAERELLEKEALNSDVQKDEVRYRQIEQRLEQLRAAGGSDQNMRAAAAEWLERYKPEWYDYAEPHSLNDRRLRNLASLLPEAETRFSPAESVKLRLMAVNSPDVDTATKGYQWVLGVVGIPEIRAAAEQWYESAQAVVDDERFPPELRSYMAFMMMVNALEKGDNLRLLKLMSDNQGRTFNDQQMAFIKSMAPATQTDRNDPQSLQKLAEQIIEHESLELMDVSLLQQAYQRLLDLGDLQAARMIYEQTDALVLGPSVSYSLPGLRMEMLRQLRDSEHLEPVHAAFREQVLALLGEDDLDPQIPKQALHDTIDQLPERTQLVLLHRQVLRGDYDRTGLIFWSDLLDTFLLLHPDEDLRVLAAYEAVLHAIEDDETRMIVLGYIYYSVDLDDREVAEALAEIVKPWRHDSESPLTSDMIVAEEFHQALRHGDVIDIDKTSRVIDHPRLPGIENKWVLNAYLARGDGRH